MTSKALFLQTLIIGILTFCNLREVAAQSITPVSTASFGLNYP